MAEERIEQSWDLIPPEKHYQSPKALLDDFNLYSTVGMEEWELSNLFSPPEGKFEIVTNASSGDERLYLIPTASSYAYLFRGQGKFHNPCLPTLYREKRTPEEVFINRVRIEEFWLMLQQYPHVRYFLDLGLNVDYIGLAQHYGLMTDVLDLTSSIKVAMFFAMCDYDKDSDGYLPKTDNNKTYVGYIYAYPYIYDLIQCFTKKNSNRLRVSPIGLQPFKRPGNQRGFAIHLENGKDFVAPIYSFKYTAQDSAEIFEQFKDIFVQDDLSKRTRMIANSNKLSVGAIKITCARYGYQILGRKISYSKGVEILKSKGMSIYTSVTPWQLTIAERTEVYDNYASQGVKELTTSLVHRKWKSDGKEMPYMDISFIGEQEMLRLFRKGCPSLPGYNSGITFVKQGNFLTSSMRHPRKQT